MSDFFTPPMRQPDDPGAEGRQAHSFFAGMVTGMVITTITGLVFVVALFAW